jgi:sRNA-binding protein
MSDSVAKVEAAISELVVAFPAAFTLDPMLVRPVKLGIRDDLCAQSTISRGRISAALRSYCHSAPYLTASKEGATRIDPTGEPAGTVTATEAQHAIEELAALSKVAKVATKRGGKVASAPGDVQTPNRAAIEKAPLRAATEAPDESDISKHRPTAEPATRGQKLLSLSDLKRSAAARKAIR